LNQSIPVILNNTPRHPEQHTTSSRTTHHVVPSNTPRRPEQREGTPAHGTLENKDHIKIIDHGDENNL